MNEEVFLQDLGTIASYYPSALCWSVLPSIVALRTLVVFGVQPLWTFKHFEKRRTCTSIWRCGMDANPIRVAP
jgi:hypothetical protein